MALRGTVVLAPRVVVSSGTAGPLLSAVDDGAAAGTTAGRVQANKAAGDAFRDEIANALKAAGREVETEVIKQTPFGRRVIDIEVSQHGRVLGGIETKVGGSRYLPSQRAKDEWLRLHGYIVDLVRNR
ncbi:MAG: hypothetical protein HS111_03710 [Kofleriaceae bacterium]|nr:hypothetical protein [Kofleriaceae bacterium]